MTQIMKRNMDIIISILGLIVLSPILIVFMVLVMLQDYGPALYRNDRVGKDGKTFKIIKLRSMIVGADKTGLESTSSDDQRITKIGSLIRKYKLDEVTQLWNVLIGDMSLVGPRPNTTNEVAKYSKSELRLLTVKPGITDISSIVFSDEGKILSSASQPDVEYDTLIRPWKSQLGILYVENANIVIDMYLLITTFVAILNKDLSSKMIILLLNHLNVDNAMKKMALRNDDLSNHII
jgi:lipopolysaccharide/colanic/teichoic acid biosynthesis glycosyltransferase